MNHTITPAQFYGSVAWARVRSAAIERDRHACVECGSFWARLAVHHVRPAFEAGRLAPDALDLDNVRTLCWSCHEKRHERSGNRKPPPARKLTPGREAWREAVRERAADFDSNALGGQS